MPSRYPGTVPGSGLGERGNAYDAIRRNYVVISDEERERAVQPSPGEIVAALRAEIAAKSPEHARLVADFERLEARRARQS